MRATRDSKQLVRNSHMKLIHSREATTIYFPWLLQGDIF